MGRGPLTGARTKSHQMEAAPSQPGDPFTVQCTRAFCILIFPKGAPAISGGNGHQEARALARRNLSSPLSLSKLLLCTFQSIPPGGACLWTPLWQSLPPLLSASSGGHTWLLPCAIHTSLSSWGATPPPKVEARACAPRSERRLWPELGLTAELRHHRQGCP